MSDTIQGNSIPTTPVEAEEMLRAIVARGILSFERIQSIVDEERKSVGKQAKDVVKIREAPSENIIHAARVVFGSNPDGIGRDALEVAQKVLKSAGFPEATLKWAPVGESYKNGIIILRLGHESVAVPLMHTRYDSSTGSYYHHKKFGSRFRGRATSLVRICALDNDENPYTKTVHDSSGYTSVADEDWIGLVE